MLLFHFYSFWVIETQYGKTEDDKKNKISKYLIEKNELLKYYTVLRETALKYPRIYIIKVNRECH